MKHACLLLLTLYCCCSPVIAQRFRTHADSLNAPRFQFVSSTTHYFGEVSEDSNVEYIFRFKNTGKTPLVITNVFSSGGGLVPQYPKEPVLPGKMGWVKAIILTQGKRGPFWKSLYIQSNALTAQDREELSVRGSIIAAPMFDFAGGATHDFGEIPEGPNVGYTFRFRNTGRQPVLVQNVGLPCGCQGADYSKEPILPGKTGWIKAIYSTSSRPGRFEISFPVHWSSAPNTPFALTLKGALLPKSTDSTSNK